MGKSLLHSVQKTSAEQHYDNLEHIYVWFKFNDSKEKVIFGSSQCSISITDQFNALLNDTHIVS